MKKQKRVVALWLAVLLALGTVLSGCMPPQFTKEYATALAKEHRDDAVAWFALYRPEARVGRKVKYLGDSQNLMEGVRGTYRVGGKTWEYAYDYVSDVMYTNEHYEEVCNLVKTGLCDELGYTVEQCEYQFNGVKIRGICANDKPDALTPAGEEIEIGGVKLLEVGIDPKAYAEATLAGDTDLRFSFWCYVDSLPEYDEMLFTVHTNLIYACFIQPVEKEYDGIYSSVWYDEGWHIDHYLHLEKVKNGMYAGYEGEIDSRFTDGQVTGRDTFDPDAVAEGDFAYAEESVNEFTLKVPGKTTPVIFTTKRKKLTRINSNGTGSTQFPGSRRACPGMPGYTVYNADIILKDAGLYTYDISSLSSVTSFRFKIKRRFF